MSVVLDAVEWSDICALEDVPRRGARRVEIGRSPLAVFRTSDDSVFALIDRCPHKHGPLSMGIVHGHSVTCPLHAWVIDLKTGAPQGADAGKGCTPRFEARVESGRILLDVRAFAA
jgi:nitrite reductase (NADH) small subunit